MTAADNQGGSTRPYLLRALHEWCTDNGFTPYIAVHVDASVRVPAEYVKNNEIVLNVGFEATAGLALGNEFIEFKARFGGVPREIVVPVDHVLAIYARENGQGMAFPMPAGAGGEAEALGAPPAAPAAAPGQGGGAPAAAGTPGRRAGLQLARQGAAGGKRGPQPARAAPLPHIGGAAPPGTTPPSAPEPPPPPGAPRPALKRIK